MIRGMTRAACFSLLFCLAAACTQQPKSIVVPAAQHETAATSFYPQPFDRLVVYGPLQVVVANDPTVKMYRVQSAQSLPLSTMATFYVANRVLYIHAINPPKIFSSYTQVNCLNIAVPQLNGVAAHNGGKIFVDNLESSHFIVKADGQGFIELNGRATRLDVTLLNKTRLDARHLQVRTLFINTTGMSQADVQNVDGLSVLSTDKSDVYFYTDPAGTANYERQSGSTIRMVGIVPPIVEDRNIK
jgi:Putative auto-transporter adhesin, head GIN domain